MRPALRKNILKDSLVFYPPCKLVSYVRFERGVCPYSGYKDCGECLPTDMDFKALELLKFAKPEDIGFC